MHPTLKNQRYSLLANSGIQFLDWTIAKTTDNPLRYFVRSKASGPLVHAVPDKLPGSFRLPSAGEGDDEIVRPEYQYPLYDSLEVYAGHWLPVPFLRLSPEELCDSGPDNWARVFISPCTSDDSPRTLTLAFDTTTGGTETRHLQPDHSDCDDGQRFIPGWQTIQIASFLEHRWLNDWISLAFSRQATDDRATSARFTYQAHYLNLLEVIASTLPCHEITLLPADETIQPVSVSLFLDLGNSHSCGIISEQHQTDDNPLLHSRELMLRDLSMPGKEGSLLFSSNVAFAPCPLDIRDCSVASGRSSAFLWPSLVRTGDEAERLTRELNRSEGMQGVSSPRRYLWDDTTPARRWYYPASGDDEPAPAVVSAFTLLINDQAETLCELAREQQFPVLHASYPRSSLLMFMICELICQAFCQMNSHHHRQLMPEYSAPRQLHSVVMTLPAAMSAAEKQKVLTLTRQALALIRQSMTYSTDASGRRTVTDYWRQLPRVRADVDEASCGQLTWLYQQLYGTPVTGDPCTHLLNRWQRPEGRLPPNGLRIALIDIGGGTTDVSVTDYLPVATATPVPVALRPGLLYRAGYPLAGEDLLYDMIKSFLLPALEHHLTRQGFERSWAIIRQLFTPGASCEGDTPWRQQFARQFFRPLAISILAFSQQSASDSDDQDVPQRTALDWLPAIPEYQVIDYFSVRVAEISGSDAECQLLAMPLSVTHQDIDAFFSSNNFRAGKLLQKICDNVTDLHPDVLLISGKSAALPAIHRLLTRHSPLPDSHIITLGGMTASESMPFCRDGELADGKCSAVTGALIHQLTRSQRFYPRYLVAGQLRPANIICELGLINADLSLPASQVVLQLPPIITAGASFIFSVFLQLRLSLGYRTSQDDQLPASPLFTLLIEPQQQVEHGCDDGVTVNLCWQADNDGQFSRLPVVTQVTDSQQNKLPISLVGIRLNTLATHGQQFPAYWTDDGRITVTESLDQNRSPVPSATAAIPPTVEVLRQN